MHHLNTIQALDDQGLTFESSFARDVYHGLTHQPKWLSSKYFYDEKGDEIFRQIMRMPSYYLTDAELEVFTTRQNDILTDINDGKPFDLIELGAGDGAKTKVLLDHFVKSKVDFKYKPCDISGNVLSILEQDISKEIPDLQIEPLVGDYFEVLANELMVSDRKKVILFLGSNIGNYTKKHSKEFVKKLRGSMNTGDILIIGVDLKKDPNVVLRAYNDPEGITASFNYNLLTRINRELGGHFDINTFRHHPVYDPVSGECRSYLLSTVAQEVMIEALDLKVTFDGWEPIFMEISRKFSAAELDQMAISCGFDPFSGYTDKKVYYKDALWRAV